MRAPQLQSVASDSARGDLNFGKDFASQTAVSNVLVDSDHSPFDGRSELGDAGGKLLDQEPLCQGIDSRKTSS